MLPLRDHLPTRSWAAVNYLLIALNAVVVGLEVAGVIGPIDPNAKTVSFDRWRRLVRPRAEAGPW